MIQAAPIDDITADLDGQLSREHQDAMRGPLAIIAAQYDAKTSKRLLGLAIKFEFETINVVTCDPWKRSCGGIPRGSFVVLRLDPQSIGVQEQHEADRLILARITDEAPTPIDAESTQMLFQMHKLGMVADPITKKELQWSGLRAKIIGTYYDHLDENGKEIIGFGNDLTTYFTAHCYAAFIPTEKHLEQLLNAFVAQGKGVSIGELRYTETPSFIKTEPVFIKIDPRDLIGELNSAQRTAIIGKTRFGKSNVAKIIAQCIFRSGLKVGQLFIDPSGEYTYINPQDGTSLYALNKNCSVRYALKARELPQEEKAAGFAIPLPLAINFYQFPQIGHSLIRALWVTVNPGNPPKYLVPILDWDPTPLEQEPNKTEYGEYAHFWRTMGLYYGLLFKSGFVPPNPLQPIYVNFQRPVKQALLERIPSLKRDSNDEFAVKQPIQFLPEIWREVHALWAGDTDKKTHFPSGSDGGRYFNELEISLLQCLGDSTKAGANYFRPFNKYHHPSGTAIFSDIINHLITGTSVFLDMANGTELLLQNFTSQICRELFRKQTEIFTDRTEQQRTVVIYFEEAQKLFRKEEKDPNNIYNVLAREGAKFNIAMVYSTQSMTTISPDLTSMTDNIIAVHLDDDREIKALEHKYMFREIARELERIQTKGFGQMATRSHRFALPIQFSKFSREWALGLK